MCPINKRWLALALTFVTGWKIHAWKQLDNMQDFLNFYSTIDVNNLMLSKICKNLPTKYAYCQKRVANNL